MPRSIESDTVIVKIDEVTASHFIGYERLDVRPEQGISRRFAECENMAAVLINAMILDDLACACGLA